MKTVEKITTDVLVIGGGGAGLAAAIQARKHNVNVLLVASSRIGYGCNTVIAGGGLAATGFRGAEDSPAQHLRDTMMGGCFINNWKLVDVMVKQAKQQVYRLMEYGVKFIEHKGSLYVRQSPGHTYPRTVVCRRRLGVGFTEPMVAYAQRAGVQFKDRLFITRLLELDGIAAGAIGLDRNGQIFVINAKSVVLATGGLGQLFSRTNNAANIDGFGYFLAYEAGLPLVDMEFTQFFPLSLADYGGSIIIIYETLAPNETLQLSNSLGENVTEKYGIKNVYSNTRDVLTRVIMQELVEGRGVGDALILDLSNISEQLREQLPVLLRRHLKVSSRFRISPTAHYQMGGIRIDEAGGTEVKGLYAAGEVCGGIHGASRLAGNALTDIFVFGTIAGDSAAQNAPEVKLIRVPESLVYDEEIRLKILAESDENENVTNLTELLKRVMWHKVGIIRSAEGLSEALEEIDSINHRLHKVSIAGHSGLIEVIELGGMLKVAEMIASAALMRTESRGSHCRSDYPPKNNPEWQQNIVITREMGNMILKVVPVDNSK